MVSGLFFGFAFGMGGLGAAVRNIVRNPSSGRKAQILYTRSILVWSASRPSTAAFSAILVYAQELLPGRIGMVSGLFFGFAFGMGGLVLPVIRKKYRQESQQRQEGADFIHQVDTGMVRQQGLCPGAAAGTYRYGFWSVFRLRLWHGRPWRRGAGKYRQESQQRQEGADFIHQVDTGMVRQQAQHRGAKAAYFFLITGKKPDYPAAKV
jgi:hypothetical protein